MTDLVGKTAPVTGSTSGIGMATAIVWRTSDDASFIHGVTLAVDGDVRRRDAG